MENKQMLKEKSIKDKLYVSLGIATGAMLLTIIDLPFDLILSLLGYFIAAYAVIKKDGTVGISQAIMVFPAMYKGIKGLFSKNRSHPSHETNSTQKGKLDKLASFALFYTGAAIIFTILFPIIDFFAGIFV